MLNGIDVSAHQGRIDWEKAKPNLSFAILRCGYGDNIEAQDDRQFSRNRTECERLGIPYGVYLYSYADSLLHAQSEAAHAIRLLGGKNPPYRVWYDLEDAGTTGKCSPALIGAIANVFCTTLENAGYKVGIYASKYWFTNLLTDAVFSEREKWVAQYADACTYKGGYSMWQHTSSGSIPGIPGRVDCNICYADYGAAPEPNPVQTPAPAPAPVVPEKISVTYQVWDDVRNAWLPNVSGAADFAGLFGHDVCGLLANLSRGNVFYALHSGGRWLPEVTNRNDYAGIYNMPADAVKIRTDTGRTVRYRVHLRKSQTWLPWVTGCDAGDRKNGYAGIFGQPFDAIQIEII